MVARRIFSFLWMLLVCILAFGRLNVAQGNISSSPPDLLSPRPVSSCFTPEGIAVDCDSGGIRWNDVSVDGQVVVFDSDSSMLVPNDTNDFSDIFVWRAGTVQRVSTGPAGEQANHASEHAAISGNGRYVYFRSRASNFSSGTLRGYSNLYIKDLVTERLALVSRDVAGAPANQLNITENFTKIDVDFSGRYVVFASSFEGFVVDATDLNRAQDIFLADVDPDHNGDYFDTPARIYLLSAEIDSVEPDLPAAGNRASFDPSIRQDGRAVVWLTRATNLVPELASNNATVDVLLAQLGVHADGSLDPTDRTFVPINRMGDGAATLTPSGARLARIDPWRDQVTFVTADDIPDSGDNHPGQDVYISVGSNGNTSDRHLVWMSHAYSFTEPIQLDMAWDPVHPAASLSQLAWVAQADLRTVADLLIERSAPLYPDGWAIVNWVDTGIPSSAPVESGGLSADGRFAFWISTEAYGLNVLADTPNLFRRQIAPAQSAPLTIHAEGGTVNAIPAGTPSGDSILYPATTLVELTPAANVGYRFEGWAGVDARQGITATVALYAARAVTATFSPMTPPIAANLVVTTAEDTPIEGITLNISDPDPDERHTVQLDTPPDHGLVTIHNNKITYQPDQNFNGEDRFTLQVTDAYGLQLTDAAEVTVQVTSVNDPPVSAYAVGNGVNDGSTIPVWVFVEDPDQDELFTLQLETPPSAGGVQSGSQLQAQGQFMYTPNEGFAGVDRFTFRAIDPGSASITGTAAVTVTLLTPTPTPTLSFTPSPTPVSSPSPQPSPQPSPSPSPVPSSPQLPAITNDLLLPVLKR